MPEQQLERDRHSRGYRQEGDATTDEVVEVQHPPTKGAKKKPDGEKLKADIDDLLDAVDEVLESNAEDFVRSYVQKGGE